MDAAVEVFAEAGYEGASFGKIAKRAGISRPVVYDHFPSKTDLHLLLLERERDRILDHVAQRFQAAQEPDRGVAAAFDAFFSYVEQHPYAWRMLFRETAGDSDMAEAQRHIQDQAHMAVATMLAKAPDSRLLTGSDHAVRLEMLAAIWGSAANGLARWWYDHRDVDRNELIAVSMDALWLGLQTLRLGERWS